jgi:hypothetical protein
VGRGQVLSGGRSGGFVDRGDASHPEILWLAACNPGASSVAIASRPSNARMRTSRCCAPPSARGARCRCTWRARRPARWRPCASSSARTGWAPSITRTCSGSWTRGRSKAVTEAPAGRRLDDVLEDGRLGSAPAIRIARQVASAVDALEEAGAPPPPLIAERIWIDPRGDAQLDGLDADLGVAPPAASSSASLAHLLGDMVSSTGSELEIVLTRALEGAYLSAGQFADELRRVETGTAQRRRDIALTIMACATLALVIVLLVAFA